jgi:excisionase family DNA binding protein
VKNRGPHTPPLIKVSGRDQQTPVLTLKQTAEYLGISKAHLSNVINHRVSGVPPLRHAKIGRRTLIRREWADQWLETAAEPSSIEW